MIDLTENERIQPEGEPQGRTVDVGGTASMRDIARLYIESGFLPIPLPLGEKAPNVKGWTKLRITNDNVGDHFGEGEQNISILLGVGAKRIADIDCDLQAAITAARLLLPETPAVFGRTSSLRSHYLYGVNAEVVTKKFQDPIDGESIVEIRGAGAQTVVPPSLHPSGERVEWDDTDEFPDTIPLPANVILANLQKTVARVATAALLARHWPGAGSGRHDAMMALAGVLARAGWSEDEALAFCDALYRSVNVPDVLQFARVKSEVGSTYQKWAKGESITGIPRLNEFIDKRVVSKAMEWLGIPSGSVNSVVDDGRPKIELRHRTLDEKVAECERVLRATNVPPILFLRGKTLVRLIHGENNCVSIQDVQDDDLSYHLSQKAIFINNGNKTNPCDKTTHALRGNLLPSTEIPQLSGIVSAPVMRVDGTILDQPGYDPASKLFYAPAEGLVVPAIPERPTKEEIAKAVAAVEDVLHDFPFADQNSRANAFAAILTPIVRPMIPGPTPIAVFDAPAAGTGKTLLAQVVAILATGTEGAMRTAPKSKDEWHKALTSQLRDAPVLIIFDNVSSRLDADELMSAVSGEIWSDRLLGGNQQVNLSIRCAWIVTSNNIQLDGQLIRRCY